MICGHCQGTGQAPDKITLVCIGCQCNVVVTYTSGEDLRAKCETVRCAECKRTSARPKT